MGKLFKTKKYGREFAYIIKENKELIFLGIYQRYYPFNQGF